MSGHDDALGEYNLAVFKIPMGGTVRPLFFITIGSKDEKGDIIKGVEYVTSKF